MQTDPRRGLDWKPWAIGLAAFVFYSLTAQRQLWGDGLFFRRMLEDGGEKLIYNHALFLPLTKLVELSVSLAVPIGPESAMKILAALAGGVGVGVTFVISRQLLPAGRGAAATAVMLACMMGFWFHSTATELHSLHAACASLLFWRLLLVLDTQTLATTGSCVLLGFACLVTVGSHVTGATMMLPIAYVFWRAGAARWRFAISIIAGLSVFLAYYAFIMMREGGLSGFTGGHVAKLTEALDWNRAPGLLLACLAEFGLYAMPALVLLPAGLRVLLRSAPGRAWLCVTWLIAWPMLAWSVSDRSFGAYYAPTFPVQAVLAISALQGLARRPLHLAVGLGMAFASVGISFTVNWYDLGLDLESGPLLAVAVCCVVPTILVGSPRPAPRSVWGLPAIALLISAIFMPWLITVDKFRDRIAIVKAFTDAVDAREGSRSLVIFLARGTGNHHHWLDFFEGALDDESRAFNPVFTCCLPRADERQSLMKSHRTVLAKALAAGRPVWIEDSMLLAMERANDKELLRRFFEELLKLGLVPEPGAPEGLLRVRPR